MTFCSFHKGYKRLNKNESHFVLFQRLYRISYFCSPTVTHILIPSRDVLVVGGCLYDDVIRHLIFCNLTGGISSWNALYNKEWETKEFNLYMVGMVDLFQPHLVWYECGNSGWSHIAAKMLSSLIQFRGFLIPFKGKCQGSDCDIALQQLFTHSKTICR